MRICNNCKSTKTYIGKEGKERWRLNEGKYYCQKCYGRLVGNKKYYNPIKQKIFNAIHNPKRIRLNFKGKTIMLKENPRKGICERCGFIGYTHIHHIQYHDDDPLKDTIELCASCHAFETHRLKQI